MGDREKKQDKPGRRPSDFFAGWAAPRSLVPVPARNPYHDPRRSIAPPPQSCWQRFTGWLRYHSIQFRWDIERSLARLLHRRWGNQP